MEQTEVKKEPIYQTSNVKDIIAPDESKTRMNDNNNTSNRFELHPGKTDNNQISILNGRVQGWFLC